MRRWAGPNKKKTSLCVSTVITGRAVAAAPLHPHNKLVAACICLLHQINLRIEKALLERFRAEAKARGLSANAAAGLAFEGWLAGGQADASFGKQAELADVLRRLEVLERKLAKAPTEAPTPSPAAPPVEPRRIAHSGDGLLTPAELETLTGTKRSTWNNWARPERIGQARTDGGMQFVLVGKADAPNGGNARWMWRKV